MPAPDPDLQASWQPALATVRNCRRTYATWFVDESSPDEGGTYHLAQWLVSFSYGVDGKTYGGRFQAGSPHRPGDTFSITFDPAHPQNHTGSDPKRKPLAAVLLWGVAAALLALLMHFFPDIRW